MRRRGAVLFVSVLALLLSAPVPAAGAGDGEAKSAHVHARGDVGPELLRQFVDLAEAAWPQWKAYFLTEPKKDRLPLVMDVRKDRDGFFAALRAVGGPSSLPGAGGYYDPKSRVSFLYLQPHLSSSRLLVLHELTHQYQYKALQDDVPDRSPVWHREGLAEHFGSHRRIEGGVETGALDVVSIDDRPVQCAQRVREGKFDPWAVGTGTATAPDYTDALALVETFLKTKDDTLRKAYREWEREIYRGGNAGSRFEKLFQGKKARLEAAAKEVWGDFRRTWSIVFIAWDEEKGVITGRGLPWALLRGGAPIAGASAFVEAEIDVARDAGGGGVALGVKGSDDLLSADLWNGGRVTLRLKRHGAWSELGAAMPTGSAAGGPTKIRLVVRGTDIVVEVAGVPAIHVEGSVAGLSLADLPGTPGLLAEGGEVRFARVKFGPVSGATDLGK